MFKKRMIQFLLVGLFALCQFSLSSEQIQTENAYSNTICPVMGNEVDPDVWIVYKGQKIYFCCPGCDKQFMKNPKKYLKILEELKAEEEEDDEW